MRVHDLMGLAVFYLPDELKPIVGEVRLETLIDDIKRYRLCVVDRTDAAVVFVDMPILIRHLPVNVLQGLLAPYKDQDTEPSEDSDDIADERSPGGAQNTTGPATSGDANA